MKDSLGAKTPLFKDIRLRGIQRFVRILTESSFRAGDFVRQKYLQEGAGFDAVSRFLQAIQLVDIKDGTFQLSKGLETVANKDPLWLKKDLLARCVLIENPYRRELYEYILCFSISVEGAAYKPHPDERSKFSDVRNFLMDLKAVSYDHEDEVYQLAADVSFLYESARREKRAVSPRSLEASLKRKKDIGLNAELAVIEYEKMRISGQWKDAVIHISQNNEAAGYDIQSVSETPEGILPRYIEVKAVSPNTREFFWSANELHVAKQLKEFYFLYLIPVTYEGKFDLDLLQVIQNPAPQIIGQPEVWEVDERVIRCRPVEIVSE